MTIAILELSCRDSIVSRDGRPFGASQGNRMRSAGWPLPSIVAGSLRTVLGKADERDFSTATALELLQVAVAGVFPLVEGQLYLPTPNDCVLEEKKGSGQKSLVIHRAKPCPIQAGDGCDWPVDGLRPVMLEEEQAQEDFKPIAGPAWWPLAHYADWLESRPITFNQSFLQAPVPEDRMHVQLDADTGATKEANLFTTTALPLMHLARYNMDQGPTFGERFAEITLAVRVNASDWCATRARQLNTLHPLGGERRLVHWQATTANPWTCPPAITDALTGKNIRMVLATPAIFRGGWKPGWLDDRLIGQPPGSTVTLRLVGVSIQRWRAVSGWSLADLPDQRRGPKPVKRLVPAGGVYFFEVQNGSASALANQWLEPMSDDEQDRRDGFGLAVWGTW